MRIYRIPPLGVKAMDLATCPKIVFGQSWGFPKIGVPLNHLFYRWIFPYETSSYGGTPILGNLHLTKHLDADDTLSMRKLHGKTLLKWVVHMIKQIIFSYMFLYVFYFSAFLSDIAPFHTFSSLFPMRFFWAKLSHQARPGRWRYTWPRLRRRDMWRVGMRC